MASTYYDLSGSVKDFGKRLKWLRERKQISRRILGELVLCSSDSILRYERGECFPDIITATLIAEYFDVPLDWLIGRY